MQRPQCVAVVLVCLIALGAGKQKAGIDADQLRGAWLQTDLKWESAPKQVNPHLRTSTGALLYFGDDHTFALMYCVVNQVPGEYTSISHGDGIALYRGRWTVDRKGVAVWYEFVSMRPKQWPGFPGQGLPIEHAIIHLHRNQLSLSDMKFVREPKLDEDAGEAVFASSEMVEPAAER